MPRVRPTPPGKIRTREHVLADLALNHIERQVLNCGFTLQRIQSDYGYDYVMWTYNALGEIQSGFAYFQVKATDNLPLLGDGETISWPVSRRDLRLWLKEAYPVVLAVYDGKKDKSYWLYVQAYFSRQPTAELFSAGETINVRFPTRNRINRASIRRIAASKDAITHQLSGRIRHDA